MTDTPAIVINPSVTPAQIRTAVRYFLTFAGPWLPKLFAGFFTPEVQAVINSDEFANMISAWSGALMGAAMWAWGAFDTWRNKQTLVAAANAAPDTKFIVAKPGEVQ